MFCLKSQNCHYEDDEPRTASIVQFCQTRRNLFTVYQPITCSWNVRRYNVEVIKDGNHSQVTDKDGDWPKQPEHQRKSNEEQPVADRIEKHSFP
ncbi:hypothetical protein DsansV1_C13g0120211 [Dioscorea sansibarensis]